MLKNEKSLWYLCEPLCTKKIANRDMVNFDQYLMFFWPVVYILTDIEP